eukprot:INCI15730.2.p1 GENE.INCI15730.2~~INCI15730.2.p1  ORF type:complete len:738 (+),score=114.61 INCI15730.2:132-2345(+)
MCCGVFPSFSFSARAVVGVGKVGAIMVGSSNSSSSASEVFVHEPSLEQHWLSLQFLKNPEIENSHRRWILGRVRPALMACSVLYAASNGVVYVLPTPSNPVTDPLLAQVVAAQIVFAILSASLIGGAWMFGGLTTTALRATEFGILCIMVGDGYGQAVLAAVQGLPFPLALVGIACGNALTGLPWFYNFCYSVVGCLVFFRVQFLWHPELVQTEAWMDCGRAIVVCGLVGYVCDASMRTQSQTRHRLRHFRATLDSAVQDLEAKSGVHSSEQNAPARVPQQASSKASIVSARFRELTRSVWTRCRCIHNEQKEPAFLKKDTVNYLGESLQRAVDVMGMFSDAEERQSTFLATMSHELRSPLTTIIGCSEILTSMPQLHREAQDLVKLVQSAGGLLLTLVNDILDFSKLCHAASQFQLDAVPFDPNALGLKCVSLFQHKANDKAVDLQLNVDCRVGTLLLGDSKRIEQIIVNFLSNGLKFTPSGGIVKLELIAREKLHNPKVIEFAISVVDTGIGIAPAQQTQLFKPFVQADAGISRKFGGTGLGLSICARLANAMGCPKIKVVSRMGQGTTFTARLLLKRAPPGSLLSKSGRVKSPANMNKLQGVRILLVEDVKSIRRVSSRLMQRAGADVIEAENGKEAVAAVQKSFAGAADSSDIDLVVMDLHMPKMNGIEAVTAIIREHGLRAPPIVGLTADVMKDAEAAFRAAGAVTVLSKPYSVSQLIKAANIARAKVMERH